MKLIFNLYTVEIVIARFKIDKIMDRMYFLVKNVKQTKI